MRGNFMKEINEVDHGNQYYENAGLPWGLVLGQI